VPDGWDVTEKEGNSKVSLTRDFQDEVVQVDFVAREVVSVLLFMLMDLQTRDHSERDLVLAGHPMLVKFFFC
jgi:hypothetical protein